MPDPSAWYEWVLYAVVTIATGGGVTKIAEGIVAYYRADAERDQQEHEQTLDLSDAEKEIRHELREQIEKLREDVHRLTEEVRELEDWTRRLVFALKTESWQKRRLFHHIDDLREDLNKPPLPEEERAKYRNPHFQKALKDTPWGDLRGFARRERGGPIDRDHKPNEPK